MSAVTTGGGGWSGRDDGPRSGWECGAECRWGSTSSSQPHRRGRLTGGRRARVVTAALLATVVAACGGGRSCATKEDRRPVESAVMDAAVVGIYNTMTPEQRRQSGIPDAPASLVDAAGHLRYPTDEAAQQDYYGWLLHLRPPASNAARMLASDAGRGAGRREAFGPFYDDFEPIRKDGEYRGSAEGRPRVARVVEEISTAAAGIGIYKALGEERRRQLGVPELPGHFGDRLLEVKLTGEAQRAEFLTWLYHPARLAGAAPGVTNSIGPMVDEALRDSGFERFLRSSGLRCS